MHADRPGVRVSHPHAQRVSVAVLPALGFVAFLMVSLLAAIWYRSVAVLTTNDPFSAVWEPFDAARSMQILGAVCLGLLLACIFPTRGPSIGNLVRQRAAVARQRFGLFVAVGLLGVALQVYAKGAYLLEAPAYLSFAAPQAFVSLANLLAPVTAIAAGVISSRQRFAGAVIITLQLVLSFSYSTRMLALLPVAFLIGRWFAGIAVRKWAVVVALICVFLLLPIPLFTRALPSHGLLPYSAALTRLEPSFWAGSAVDLLGNVGFTAPLAQYVTDYSPSIPRSAFFASVDPGIGATSWDAWAPLMRVHFFIPYSAIGEFGQLGALGLIGFGFFWGVFSRLVVSFLAATGTEASRLLVVASLGLMFLTILYASQYNTRSVSRIFWIVAILCVCVWIFRVLRRSSHAATVRAHAG